MTAIPLSNLAPGRAAVVIAVDGAPAASLRLAELGLTPQAIVEVLLAPRRNPMVIEVRGSRLALDPALAAAVSVRPLPAGSATP